MTAPKTSPPEAAWALAHFNRSVPKQAKFRQILARLDDPAGKRGLDIGADNGVISYLLRQRTGRWHSADLDERVVMSIRQLVGGDRGASPSTPLGPVHPLDLAPAGGEIQRS